MEISWIEIVVLGIVGLAMLLTPIIIAWYRKHPYRYPVLVMALGGVFTAGVTSVLALALAVGPIQRTGEAAQAVSDSETETASNEATA